MTRLYLDEIPSSFSKLEFLYENDPAVAINCMSPSHGTIQPLLLEKLYE